MKATKRKLRLFLMAVFAVVALSACANDNEKADDQSQDSAGNTQLEDKVVVYSTHSEELLEMVAEAFEEKTGVAVEYVNLKGELAERVEAEKENPQADVMYGGASNLFMDLTEKVTKCQQVLFQTQSVLIFRE